MCWSCEQCDNYYETSNEFAHLGSQLKRLFAECAYGFSGLFHDKPVTCHECLSILCVNCVYNQVAAALDNNSKTILCPLCDEAVDLELLDAIPDGQLLIELADSTHAELQNIRNGDLDVSTCPNYLNGVFARLQYVVSKTSEHAPAVQQYVCCV